MDVRLPGIDGFQATEPIRSHPEWKEVPVLAVTAIVFDPETRPRADRHLHRTKAVGRNRVIAENLDQLAILLDE